MYIRHRLGLLQGLSLQGRELRSWYSSYTVTVSLALICLLPKIPEVFYSPFRERLLLDINPFLLLCVRHIVFYRPMSKLCLLCRGSSRARATASVLSIYPSEVLPASILAVGLYSAYLRLNAVPCASSPQKGESQLRFSGFSAWCLSIAVCAVLLTSAVVVCYKVIGSDK